nr:hypothetical protein Iba_chr15aCG12300 [Ipomoea batatas]
MMKSFDDIEDSHFKLKEENAQLLAERQDLEDLRFKNAEMLESISQHEKQRQQRAQLPSFFSASKVATVDMAGGGASTPPRPTTYGRASASSPFEERSRVTAGSVGDGGWIYSVVGRSITEEAEGSRSSEEPSPPVPSSLPSTMQRTNRGVLSVRSSPEYAATVAIAERERRTVLAAEGLVADAGKGCKSPTLPPPPVTHHRKTGDDGRQLAAAQTADALMSIAELSQGWPEIVAAARPPPTAASREWRPVPAYMLPTVDRERREGETAYGRKWRAAVHAIFYN